MTVIFRADANATLGSGHVARCVALAEVARSEGHDVIFVSQGLSPALCDWLGKQKFGIVKISAGSVSADAAQTSEVTQHLNSRDWLVVDHYDLDIAWELAVRRGSGRLFVLDDLANRRHHCDALLDAGMHARWGNPYEDLLEGAPQLFLGPTCAIIRDEFIGVEPRQQASQIDRLLVHLGGGDKSSIALVKVARALERWGAPSPLVTFLADDNQLGCIKAQLDRNSSFTSTAPMADMAKLLTWADAVIGASGNSVWERLLLGVPSFCFEMATNQRDDLMRLTEAGAVVSLGNPTVTQEDDILAELQSWSRNPDQLSTLTANGYRLLDGRDTAKGNLRTLFSLE